MNGRAPAPLTALHLMESFSCGIESLVHWVRHRALKVKTQDAFRAYVMCKGARIYARYALASGAISTTDATGRFRRNMPAPKLIVVLGRSAVDQTLHGKGFSRALVSDAGLRVLQVAYAIGLRGITVHALSEDAKRFYEKIGFEVSSIDPYFLMITLPVPINACE
jgi:GNAT superfamily N-acetyltransferase